MSAADIDKGTKWRHVLTGELAAANFGIICLTPESLNEPWLLFEAGVLSKTAESRVWTYLFEVDFASVKDPLSEFNHTSATKDDTRLLVRSINAITGDSLPQIRVDRAFDALWPELEAALSAIPKPPQAQESPQSKPLLPSEEMLKEVLLRVRELERNSRPPERDPLQQRVAAIRKDAGTVEELLEETFHEAHKRGTRGRVMDLLLVARERLDAVNSGGPGLAESNIAAALHAIEKGESRDAEASTSGRC
jgi:hypothetical protein